MRESGRLIFYGRGNLSRRLRRLGVTADKGPGKMWDWDAPMPEVVTTDDLVAALEELVQPSVVGPWLEANNPALEGSTPLQVIKRGESERVWRIIWQLREGNVGD